MNTFLSAEQQALKNKLRSLADSASGSLAGSLKEYLGMTVPAQHGGQSLALLDFVLLAEAVSRLNPGLGVLLANHAAVIEVIKKYGDNAQQSLYLSAAAKGKCLAGLAFSEQNAGCDFAAVETALNGSVLKGNKNWIVDADKLDLLLVLAKDAAGALTLCLADVAGAKTINSSAKHNLSGLKEINVSDLTFNDHPLKENSIIKSASAAEEMAVYALNIAAVIMAAASLGIAGRCLELAADHAKTRQQFGKNIGQFQGVQWKLADAAVEYTGAQMQTYRAALSVSEDAAKFALYAPMAKFYASKAARVHSGEAMQILGTAGLTDQTPLSQLYQDAKAMEIFLGTSELQKMLMVKELAI